MYVLSRLNLLAEYIGVSADNFHSGLLKFSADNSGQGYPKRTTIYNYFNLKKKVKGEEKPSSGARRDAHPNMDNLVADYTSSFCKKSKVPWSYDLRLNSPLGKFVSQIRTRVSFDCIKAQLTPESRELVEAFLGSATNKSLYIPKSIRLKERESSDLVKPVCGKYGMYRFRGEHHDDYLMVEELIEIWFDVVPWMRYVDWHGEEYKGVLIIGSDKLSGNLLSDSSTIHNLRGVHVSFFLNNIVDDFLVSLVRYKDQGRAHAYRAVSAQKSSDFLARGQMKRICGEAIQYFHVLDVNRPVSGECDSSFAIDVDDARWKLKLGLRMSNLYHTKTTRSSVPQLASTKRLDKVVSYLENRIDI